MPLRLTASEKKFAQALAGIKHLSGSHSPSPAMLASLGVEVKRDFCYLANPYATELFLKRFRKDFRSADRLRAAVELYPSQNRALAEKLERIAGVTSERIFVGNGAAEVIQAVLHTFVRKKILVPVPTFSPYLEFAQRVVRVETHQLRREKDFLLEPKRLLEDVRTHRPDAVVIINPNNPNGGYLNAAELQRLLRRLAHVRTVIVDESFIHFAGKRIQSVASMVSKYPNLVVIKSLSKDFGIAGLRLGYAVMSKERVSALLSNGYLWNVSGFGEYFLDLLSDRKFMMAYEKARLRAIRDRDVFFEALKRIPRVRAYPSSANSLLLELSDGTKASNLMVALLLRHGIYVRTCYDKVGLKGEYIRVASRKGSENQMLLRALREALAF